MDKKLTKMLLLVPPADIPKVLKVFKREISKDKEIATDIVHPRQWLSSNYLHDLQPVSLPAISLHKTT